MKLSSDFTGIVLKEYQCSVSSRWTMNYAAATGDTNPRYFNDELPGGLIAPPLFPVAVTWPIIEHIADNIESADFPKEVLFTQVHFSEQLIIHRPVKPGDHIKVNGSVAAILPHKAGTHVILRFDASDAGGNSVFTEYLGAMMRGVECTGGGKGGGNVPDFPVMSAEPELLHESVVPVSPLAPFLYDGCSNIHFPIHTSVKFAHAVGLPGIILQGTAALAIAVREILDREGICDTECVASIICKFTGMILPGSNMRVRLTGRSVLADSFELFFDVLNTEGKKAVSGGCIKLKR
ncbi:MAG TPA: MaoC/PaaZ C-terminal domain-containing protein [Spirochaetota bacterium]|nr:MaoC/PaaZ C-terminal domain-containing protein [Spirochaetota bacterium]HPS87943.1 MaoC/PaaZ C-terminal domain-containing protein [Spirochaetota bacterium]